MPEPTDAGEIIEYAVRYDAPEAWAGTIGHIRSTRSLAELIAAQERQGPGDFRCTVMQRTIKRGEWTPCDV